MGDLATLLGAIGTLVLAGTSTIGLWFQLVRSSRRERKDAAEIATERTQQVAAEEAMDELLDALANDGRIDGVELGKIREHLHHSDPKEADGE